MNRKARWRLGVLLAVLLLAVAALGASVGKSARQGVNRQAASNTLIDGTTDTVVNIDPAASYDLGSQAVQYEIFQHLLEAGPGRVSRLHSDGTYAFPLRSSFEQRNRRDNSGGTPLQKFRKKP